MGIRHEVSQEPQEPLEPQELQGFRLAHHFDRCAGHCFHLASLICYGPCLFGAPKGARCVQYEQEVDRNARPVSRDPAAPPRHFTLSAHCLRLIIRTTTASSTTPSLVLSPLRRPGSSSKKGGLVVYHSNGLHEPVCREVVTSRCPPGQFGSVGTALTRRDFVPGAGLEPARPFRQRLLRPPRLPFRHPGLTGS